MILMLLSEWSLQVYQQVLCHAARQQARLLSAIDVQNKIQINRIDWN